jgi:hypothetical protein
MMQRQMAMRETSPSEPQEQAISRTHALLVAGFALLAPVLLLGAAYMLVLR